MDYTMTMKGASAKVGEDGMFSVKILFEAKVSSDLMRDIMDEANELNGQEVRCQMQAIQPKMELKK